MYHFIPCKYPQEQPDQFWQHCWQRLTSGREDQWLTKKVHQSFCFEVYFVSLETIRIFQAGEAYSLPHTALCTAFSPENLFGCFGIKTILA